MLKYLTKIAMDILPSVVATVIGAYIVNHYINAKPATDTPAAAVASVDPKADPKSGTKAASLPEPGVKARGISERALIEKTASERPAEVKPTEKAEKPVETASLPAEQRRRPILSFSRDKAAEKSAAEKAAAEKAATEKAAAEKAASEKAASEKAASEKALAKAAPAAAPLVEAAAPASEEHRDAADLARAAIERLRTMSPADPATKDASAKDNASKSAPDRTQEAARTPELPVVQEPRVAAVPVRPLPPPITVSTPPAEQTVSAQPSYTASVGPVDPNRPTPPADIPAQPPLDLRADAAAANPRDHARNVAEDMLSAAKSVFHAVIPGTSSSSSSRFAD